MVNYVKYRAGKTLVKIYRNRHKAGNLKISLVLEAPTRIFVLQSWQNIGKNI